MANFTPGIPITGQDDICSVCGDEELDMPDKVCSSCARKCAWCEEPMLLEEGSVHLACAPEKAECDYSEYVDGKMDEWKVEGGPRPYIMPFRGGRR